MHVWVQMLVKEQRDVQETCARDWTQLVEEVLLVDGPYTSSIRSGIGEFKY